MTAKKPAVLKPFALIAGAALLGVLAGVVAVYVNGTPDVNQAVVKEASPPATTVAGDDAACAIDDAKRAKLNTAATGAVAAMAPVSTPYQAGSLAFNRPDGTKVTIANFNGKTVLLNLWATWCVPCREEMPALDQLQAKVGGVDFEVAAVNVESGDPEKRKAFLTSTGIKALKDYNDPELALFNDLKKRGLVLGLPVTLLIGKDGCLLSSMNGPAAWASDEAVNLIESAKGL